ncbi:response regulator [Paenibacillus puerhi]|uniref:response regulator n=1 Tax=Paenibacillus puerhi TaxID=2692622 RepID=UPI001357D556|nr:response regulator [Paenibacillus puerhi]
MYRFIIVDDEALIRRGMLKKIQTSPLKDKLQFVGEADNGRDGLELIHKVDPDIILTDMRMPEMDGKSFLRLLQNDYPDKKVIVISGYSDFEYMKEAISAKVVGYLLKPFNREEIHDTLEKAIHLIEAERSVQQKLENTELEMEEISYSADLQALYNLFLGNHHKEKALSLRSGKLKLLAQAERFILLTIYSTAALEPVPRLPENCIFIPHLQNVHMGFLVLFLADDGADLHRAGVQTAELISRQLDKQLAGDAVIGVSRVKASLMQLEEAYQETIIALDGRSIAVSHKINTYKGEKLEPESAILPWKHMDELLFFLESGHVSKVTELTSELFDYFNTIPTATVWEIKNTCRGLIQQVKNMLQSHFEALGEHSSSSSFDDVLSGSYDVETIKAYLLQVLPGIGEMLSEQGVYRSGSLIDNIKLYIQKHYHKELTLDKISSLFFINPSYCSYLFKEKTGINFIDFVNKVRIDQAKTLLQTTDEKVYKIAKSLGYENTKYFFRVFKKATGFTPEEYRTTSVSRLNTK